jgi:cholera toxin transcriptional activator
MMSVERFALIEPEHEMKKLRFGVFELDTATGELWRDGKAQPRLRDQALQILRMLLEHPRELVTRENLRDRLWSSDTFVDFDHGLNTAVNQLRSAFGDSAANPRYIQTVPRRGYRFIAPVEITSSLSPGVLAQGPSVGNIATSSPGEILDSAARSSILSDSHELPSASKTAVRILFSLIQLMYLIFYVLSLARLSQVEAILGASRGLALPILVLLIVTAAMGIPIRLYLLAATAFNYRGLNIKFQKLFPFLLPLDELWALAPFLITHRLGFGLAIAATAALLFLPFSQRSLLLMGFSVKQPSD